MSRALLKEAIADAKAVKEAAIANAKAALEEAFTPHLKELLASKLESLDESEEAYEAMMRKKMMEDDGMMDEASMETESDDLDEMNLDEILAELEGLDEKKIKTARQTDNIDSEEGDDPFDAGKSKHQPMDEAKKKDSDDESEDEEDEKKESEEVSMEDMTEEDLKKLIEDVIEDMIESGDLEGGEGKGEESLEDLGADVMAGEESGEEESEEIDLEELMLEMEMDRKPMKEFVPGGPSEENALLKAVDAAIAKGGDLAKKLMALLAQGGGGWQQGGMYEEELNEAYATIKTLRSDLNEVNLLNAKLLYTNKIFKAKNLTESQKVKVLSTFDKATTVKEVKLVFESLSTSISTSSNTAKAPIKESMGFASKASGIVKNNQTIETDAVIARMKKLAGL